MLKFRLTLTAIFIAIITVSILSRRPEHQCLQLAVAASDGASSHIYLLTFDFVGHTHWQQLTNLPGFATEPAWSPDGSQIAFEKGAVIYIVGVDTHQIRQVIDGHSPVWSPDGTKLAFWDGSSSPGFRQSRADIYTIDLTSGVVERVTRNEDIPTEASMREDVGRSVDPDWHGSGLLYENADNSLYAVAMMRDAVPGLDVTGLLPRSDFARDPAWSPDGEWIAFYSAFFDSVGGGVHRMQASTGEIDLVAHIGEGGGPSWHQFGIHVIIGHDPRIASNYGSQRLLYLPILSFLRPVSVCWQAKGCL